MKRSKWLVALVLDAASLTSNMANATVVSSSYLETTLTSSSVLFKFLSESSWLNFIVLMGGGGDYTTTDSGNVDLNNTKFAWSQATIGYGNGALSDGSYGWLKFTPVAGQQMAFSWTGGDISVTPVPEPEVLALLGIGAAGLLLARRRQKNQPTLAI